MKINKPSRALGVAAALMIGLAGCGSATNSDATGDSTNGPDPAVRGTGAAAKKSNTGCFEGELHAAGSTAQKNAITKAISSYQQKCPGAKISYNGTGSGAGITSFTSNQIDFAGSDSALDPSKDEPAKASKACGSPAWNVPMVTGPIAVAYNVPGVDTLNLTPELIAKIFDGRVTNWNDPAIAAENKGMKLPDTRISVFFRSDSSGTTDNFTNYLHTTAPDVWTADHSKSWSGKVGQGKPKSAGVSAAVKATKGAISYVEWSYATANDLDMAKIDSGGGPVALTAESAGKAVSSAKVVGKGKDLSLHIDYATKTPGAYPLVLVTYEIACSSYDDPRTGKRVKAFLSYMASPEFQSTLTEIGSAPLPSKVQSRAAATISAIS